MTGKKSASIPDIAGPRDPVLYCAHFMGRRNERLAVRRFGVALVLAFAFPATVFGQADTPPTVPGEVKTNAAAATAPTSAAAGKTTNQFRITSEDPESKLAFSTFADTVDRQLRQLIRDQSDWVYPVNIYIKGSLSDLEEGPATANRINLLPNDQFNLTLGIRLSRSFNREEAVRELLRLLIFERMLRPYRESPGQVAGKNLEVPPWLVYGARELMVHRQNGQPSDFYAGIVQSRQVLTADEILQGDPGRMDSLSAAVHKASSAALIAALLDQPKGHENFREFLADLAGLDSTEVAARLRQHFPGLRGSAGALEKWWSLQVAHMGQKQAFEFLTARETETLLEEALIVRFGMEPEEDPKGVLGKFLPKAKPGQPMDAPLHDYETFLERLDAKQALGENRLRLRSLSLRCFPLYRNVVARYEAVVVLLLENRKRGLRQELDAIDRLREVTAATLRRVDDYMNYYEATQGEGKSRAFESYRKTREKIERRRRPNRKDRISQYLDALEAEFADEGGAP